jgi:hypothetical protein
MCVTVVLRRVRCDSEEEPITVTKTDSTGPSICLFGGFCWIIKHSHIIYQDDDFEICAECDQKTLDTARWALTTYATATTVEEEEPSTHAECNASPLPFLVHKYNEIVQSELVNILSRRIEFSKCKALLHYILGLPRFIDRTPLIDVFGKSVGRWCGYKRAAQLRDIAAEHKLGREMAFALQFAFRRHVEKAKARLRKRNSESAVLIMIVSDAY